MDKKLTILLPIINFCIIYFLINKIIDISIYDSIGYSITITLLEILIFKKWLWKIKFIQQITGINNIQGVWNGRIISNFDNKEHMIEKVIIKQSFNRYKIVLETKESKSFSDINKILINELRAKNPMHFGVADLEYKENKLIGTYWTDREINDGKNTRGTMELKRTNEKGNYDLINIWDIFDLF